MHPQPHRRTLGWLLGAALVMLLPSGYYLVLRLVDAPLPIHHQDIGSTLATLVGYLGAAWWIGGIASLEAQAPSPLARTALIVALVSLIGGGILFTGILDVVDVEPETRRALGQARSVVALAARALVCVWLASLVRSTAGWITLGVMLAVIATGLVTRSLDEVPRELGLTLDIAGPVTFAAFVLTLFVTAPKELGARPHAGSWEVAMRGARLVRGAEIARIALVAGAFLLGLVTAASRSFDLLLALGIGSAIGACVITCVSLVGFARLRDIPLASDARGPAAATFVLAMSALAFALTGLVVGLLDTDMRRFGPVGPDPYVVGGTVYGLATTAAFVNTIRRAGRALADAEVVARAQTAIVTWLVGLALAAVSAFAVRLPAAAPAALSLAGIALQVVGVVALIQGLRALELALARRDRAEQSQHFG